MKISDLKIGLVVEALVPRSTNNLKDDYAEEYNWELCVLGSNNKTYCGRKNPKGYIFDALSTKSYVGSVLAVLDSKVYTRVPLKEIKPCTRALTDLEIENINQIKKIFLGLTP